MTFWVGDKYKVKKDCGLLCKGVTLKLKSIDRIGDGMTFLYDNCNTEIEVSIKYHTAVNILEPLDEEDITKAGIIKEIELINKIIYEAIIHGGDSGGPYNINFEDLEKSVNNWLKFKNLTDEYKFVNDNQLSRPLIIKKE